MFFIPKRRSNSASSAFNVKKGIRCNYIPNMKALEQEYLLRKNKTRAVGGQRARLQAAYSHKALFHYIALKYY